ncbi:unnamed protein product [Pleuronectes platessa]|uniref:Uncharacterized protein n=1 Tax=Pleuronectes platessa TaxID=8262 RepID=A0A9N7UVJ9_PLEPL|nr:unnamed protein product [Pleuronectes platessa]
MVTPGWGLPNCEQMGWRQRRRLSGSCLRCPHHWVASRSSREKAESAWGAGDSSVAKVLVIGPEKPGRRGGCSLSLSLLDQLKYSHKSLLIRQWLRAVLFDREGRYPQHRVPTDALATRENKNPAREANLSLWERCGRSSYSQEDRAHRGTILVCEGCGRRVYSKEIHRVG